MSTPGNESSEGSSRRTLAAFTPILWRTFGAALLFALPLFALMLVPQLMRSRAGSEQLLIAGTTIYLLLNVVLVVVAPAMSGWAVPFPPKWTLRTAIATTNQIRRTLPRTFWLRVAECVGIYLLAQVAGMLFAEVVPYAVLERVNTNLGEYDLWHIRYGPYFAQQVIVYAITCFGLAWYGTRLRHIWMNYGVSSLD